MRNAPSNSDDVVDSRAIIERIQELEGERDAWGGTAVDAGEEAEQQKSWAEENEEEAAELTALLALREEAQDYAPDWQHGATLIRDSYFETYARDFARDIGAIKDETSWPYTCIDWKEAAEELQQDYTSVEWDGVTYWIR